MKSNFHSPSSQCGVVETTLGSARVALSLADDRDREVLYRIRHEVFARELGQHAVNPAGRLHDAIDGWNVYIVVKIEGEIAGSISITPPGGPAFSIDKYFQRERLPLAVDDTLYEVRLLTVVGPHRGRELAALLMYAAFRWIEARGGRRIVAIGRREILDLYLRVGMEAVGPSARSGAVTYDLLHAETDRLRERFREFDGLLARLEERTDWRLGIPFRRPAPCFHGGASIAAVGEKFDGLERRRDIINADVLDAWFPPAPGVLAALEENLDWILRTSPPAGCEGLIEAIARARGVSTANVLPGAGSSDLIFRAFRHWLSPASRVLILDPTYGEYPHLLERVIGCAVDRLTLERASDYDVDLDRLEAAFAGSYDLIALVNPNSPTGRHIPRAEIQRLLRRVPPRTRVWVDETYVDYAGPDQSIERFAARSENVVVCKSMSKVYALSGARVAYLCASPHQFEGLRAITPPWIVSFPGQLAAVRALDDPEHYAGRYRETAILREQFADRLRAFDWEIVPGVANFLLCHLPEGGPEAAEVVRRCRHRGLYLRDAGGMGSGLGPRALRIAVKDASTNRRMVRTIAEALEEIEGDARN